MWLPREEFERRFPCGEVIGEGGYAVVYASGAHCVKVFTPLEQPGLHVAAIIELHMGKQLCGAVFAALAAFTIDGDYVAIAMERGTPLSSAPPLAPDELVELTQDLLSALAAIHARFVRHGDVSRSNVVRGAGGRWQLIDFGSAEQCEVRGGRVVSRGLPYTQRLRRPGAAQRHDEMHEDLYAAMLVVRSAGAAVPPALLPVLARMSDGDAPADDLLRDPVFVGRAAAPARLLPPDEQHECVALRALDADWPDTARALLRALRVRPPQRGISVVETLRAARRFYRGGSPTARVADACAAAYVCCVLFEPRPYDTDWLANKAGVPPEVVDDAVVELLQRAGGAVVCAGVPAPLDTTTVIGDVRELMRADEGADCIEVADDTDYESWRAFSHFGLL